MRKLLFLIVLMIFPLAACADFVEVNGIKYNLNSVSKTAEVAFSYLNKNNYSGDIVLPDAITHEGVDYPITSVAASAFLDCEKVTSVKLPNSLKTIGSVAFQNCTNMTSISIPHGVTSIASSAFSNCKSLKSIIIPNSLTTIERNTFSNCTGLTSLTIPEGVTTISKSAFYNCTSLKTVIFPSTLSSIDIYAFGGCTSLRDIYSYAETVPNADRLAFGSGFTLHVPEGNIASYMRNSLWNSLTIVAIGAPVSKTETYYFTGVSNDGLVSNNPWGGYDNAFWSAVSSYHFWSDRASAIGAHCNYNDYVYTWSKETYPEVINKVTVNAGAWSDVSTGLKLNNREVTLKTIRSSAYAGNESRIQFDDYVFENVSTSDNNGHLLLEYVLSGQADIFIRSITIEYVEGGGCDMLEIPTDNAFYAATSFLCERGVLDGSRDDGKYLVEKELLRKHLANITFRGLFTLKGREIPSTFVSDQYSSIYKDLASNAPYCQAAKTLLYLDYGDGITPFDRDRDGFFPENYEYRINVLKELMEAFNIKPDMEGKDNPFPNDPGIAQLSETSPIRMGYVRRAAKLGIITTENTEFHPFVDCLRGEAFLMLARIIQKIEAGEIADPNPQESDFLDPNYKPKSAEPYAALSDNNTVLTFYYDDQREQRNGTKVGSINAAPSWYNASVTTIVIDPSFANCTTITRTAYWFDGFANVTSITGLQYLKTDNVTSMRNMFFGCSKLTSLDLSGFNTENVTDMGAMFNGCFSLTSLDLSGFNTENVTDMYSMFQDCRSLTSLDLSSFKTDNVTNMYSMFMFCRSLKRLNLSGFKTDNVTNMSYMFYLCISLKRLYLSSFKTDKVSNMDYMFYYCSDLTTIYVGDDWSTAAVTSSSSMMFADCYKLSGGAGTHYNANHTNHTYAHIDSGTANPGYFTDKNAAPTGNAEPYAALSDNNTVLTFYYDDQMLERNGMDIEPFISYPSWYGQSESITNVVFDASFTGCTTLTSTAWWFSGLQNLSSITGISNLKTDKVTNMEYMFYGCSGLTSLDVTGFKTDNVTSMSSMFDGCSGLTSLDVTGFKTDNVTSMYCMFGFCSGLTSLDVTSFETDNVKYMSDMFWGCSSLKTIYAGDGWSTAKVQNSESMFYGCTSLVGGAGTIFDGSHTNYTYAHIDGGASNPGYFTAKAGGYGEKPEGDLSGDGEVDDADMDMLVSVVMGGNKDKLADADLNHDGKVDAADIVTLVNIIKSRK